MTTLTSSPFRLRPAPLGGGFAMDGYWVWDPSILRDPAGRWQMFCSRWPTWLPFHPGWMIASEVVRASADRAEGPYRFEEVVLPPRGAEFWDGRATHNPRIAAVPGGGYALFYTGFTHALPDLTPEDTLLTADAHCIVARASKRVGVATAPTLAGPWTRRDTPLLPTKPRTFYSFLTSNVSPVFEPDGSLLMTFKSRRYVGNTHSGMALGLARADSLDGPAEVIVDEPIFSPERFGEVEDPFLWRDPGDGRLHMIAKDMTGRLCGVEGGGVHATSPDGQRWSLANPARAYSRAVRWSDGTTVEMGSFERPFLALGPDGRPTHLCAAVADGPGGFTRASKTWNVVIPLETGVPGAEDDCS